MFGNARWTEREKGRGSVANEISELHRDNYEDNLAGIKLPVPRRAACVSQSIVLAGNSEDPITTNGPAP